MIEIWQNIKGYEGKYQISNKGRIKSLIFSNRQAKFMREKILKPQFNSNYYQVSLTKDGITKQFTIHRLMAQTFIPNPYNYPCVNHKDGNKKNNSIDNLEWCNFSYNTRHSYDNLLQKIVSGKEHWSYGKPSKKRKAIQQYDLNNSFIKIWGHAGLIEKKLNINANNIRECCRGKRESAGGYKWKYV